VALVVVLGCAFAANWRFLDHDFRATDTLPLIESGQIDSPGDVGRIFSEELLADSSFEAGPYYRPISVLSYGVDHAVWGLHAFGYNLTNTILHMLVAAATFVVMRRLAGSLAGATVAGVVVALHPLVVESVPSPARRHDMLATLFVLVASALLARATESVADDAGTSSPRPWTVGVLPALALVLAVWSKEAAVVGVLPMLTLVWFRAREGLPARARWRVGASWAAPLLLGVLAAVAVRAAVVDGNDLASASGLLHGLWPTTHETLDLLLYPQVSIATRPVVLWSGVVLAAVVAALLASDPDTRDRRRLRLVLAVAGTWVAGMIVLVALTMEFALRTLYGIVPSFGMALGAAAVVVVRAIGRTQLAWPAAAALLIVAGTLVRTTPAIEDYQQWDAAGEFTSALRTHLDAADVRMLEGESVLRVPVLPRRAGPGTPPLAPRVRSATVVNGDAIEAYLEMTHPDGDVRVDVVRYGVLPPRATDFRFEMRRAQDDPWRWRLRIASVTSPPAS
jgi:hypothetical protein